MDPELARKIRAGLDVLRETFNFAERADPFYLKAIFIVLETTEHVNHRLFLKVNWSSVVRIILQQLIKAQVKLCGHHPSEVWLRKIILTTLGDKDFARFTLSHAEYNSKDMKYMGCRLLCYAYTNNEISLKDSPTNKLLFMLDSYRVDICRKFLSHHRNKINEVVGISSDEYKSEDFSRVCKALLSYYRYFISLNELYCRLKNAEQRQLIKSEALEIKKALMNTEKKYEVLIRLYYRNRVRIIKRRSSDGNSVASRNESAVFKKRRHTDTNVNQLTEMMSSLSQEGNGQAERPRAKKSKHKPRDEKIAHDKEGQGRDSAGVANLSADIQRLAHSFRASNKADRMDSKNNFSPS
jgi:hypothetical protein